MKPPGFSTTELVVTTSIIIALLVCIMPSLMTIRKSVRTSQCANNLRQMSIAEISFCQDNKGMTVPSCTYGSWNSNQWVGNGDFLSRVCDRQGTTESSFPAKLLCPVAKTQTGTGTIIGRAYGKNLICHWWDIQWPSAANAGKSCNRATGSLQDPGGLTQFADALDWWIDQDSADPASGAYNGYWKSGSPAPEGVKQDSVAYRHGSRANVVFYDGHVKNTPPSELYQNSMFLR